MTIEEARKRLAESALAKSPAFLLGAAIDFAAKFGSEAEKRLAASADREIQTELTALKREHLKGLGR